MSPSTPSRSGLLATLAVCLLAGAGCSPRGPLRVGVIAPMSGANAEFGEQFVRGLELALGPRAPAVELVVRDDEADPSRSAERVRELAADDRVVAIVGSVTGPCCLAAAGRAELLKIPLVSPAGTDPRIAEGCRWVFQTCFTDEEQGAELAALAKRKDLRRVAILEDLTNDYSIGLAAAFASAFLAAGGEIVDEAAYRPDRFDGDGLARWLADLACDALFLPLYLPDVMRVIDATTPVWSTRRLAFLGGDGWDSSEERIASVRWPDAVWITNHFSPDDPESRVREFSRHYADRHPGSPPSALSALAYDAGALVGAALESGAKDRDALASALGRALDGGFAGVTGQFAGDAVTRRRKKDVKIVRRTAGAWVTER